MLPTLKVLGLLEDDRLRPRTVTRGLSSAIRMFSHLGFVHEGTLRKSRPHEGARFDSAVMGILAAEYAQQSEEHNERIHTV